MCLTRIQPAPSDRVPDVTLARVTTTSTQPAQRARRPTTLAYCERSVALPRARRSKPPDVIRPLPPAADQPRATVVTVSAEVVVAPAPPPHVVAPTATPEDSYVEDGSSSCTAQVDSLPIDQSCAAVDTLSAAAVTASSAAQRLHDDQLVSDARGTLDTSCLDSQEAPRLPVTSSTDAPTQHATVQRRAAVRRIHRVISGARQRLLRQLSHRTVADEKSTVTAAAFSDDQASSSVTAVDDEVQASSTSSRSLLAVTDTSSSATGLVTTTVVETDACSSVGSSTGALSDHAGSDTDTLAADVSLVLGGHRISPASPSYDEKHARFCHVGAHALDVFYSPDDDDDDETSGRSESATAATSSLSLWRPLASCSTTLREHPSTSLHGPTRSVAIADHVTSGPWLASVPEAVLRPRVADDGSVSVQRLTDDVHRSTSSVLAVLSSTEATRSSTLASSAVVCAASVQCDRSTFDVVDCRFVLFLLALEGLTIHSQSVTIGAEIHYSTGIAHWCIMHLYDGR